MTAQKQERRKLTDVDARCDRVDTNALEGLVEQSNVCGLLAGQFSGVCANIAGQLSLVAGCKTHEPSATSLRHQLEMMRGFHQRITLQITASYGDEAGQLGFGRDMNKMPEADLDDHMWVWQITVDSSRDF